MAHPALYHRVKTNVFPVLVILSLIVGCVVVVTDAEFNPIKNIFRLTRPRPPLRSRLATAAATGTVRATTPSSATHEIFDKNNIPNTKIGASTSREPSPTVPADKNPGFSSSREKYRENEQSPHWTRHEDVDVEVEGKRRYASYEKMKQDHPHTHLPIHPPRHHGNQLRQPPSNLAPRRRLRQRPKIEQKNQKIKINNQPPPPPPPTNREADDDDDDNHGIVAMETPKMSPQPQWKRRTTTYNFERQKIIRNNYTHPNFQEESPEFRRSTKPKMATRSDPSQKYDGTNWPKYGPPPPSIDDEDDEMRQGHNDHRPNSRPPPSRRPQFDFEIDQPPHRPQHHHGDQYRGVEASIRPHHYGDEHRGVEPATIRSQIVSKAPQKNRYDDDEDDAKLFRNNFKSPAPPPDDDPPYQHHHDDGLRAVKSKMNPHHNDDRHYHHQHDDDEPQFHHLNKPKENYEALPLPILKSPPFSLSQNYQEDEPSFFIRGENSEEMINFDGKVPDRIVADFNVETPKIPQNPGGRSIEVGSSTKMDLPDPQQKDGGHHDDHEQLLKSDTWTSTPSPPVQQKEDENLKIEGTTTTTTNSNLVTSPPNLVEQKEEMGPSNGTHPNSVQLLGTTTMMRSRNHSDHFMIQESLQLNPNLILQDSQTDPLTLLENILKADAKIRSRPQATENLVFNQTAPAPPPPPEIQPVVTDPNLENNEHHDNVSPTPEQGSPSSPPLQDIGGGHNNQKMEERNDQVNSAPTTPQIPQVQSQKSNGPPLPQNFGHHDDDSQLNVQEVNKNMRPTPQNIYHHANGHSVPSNSPHNQNNLMSDSNPINSQLGPAVHQIIDQHVNNFMAKTDHSVVNSDLSQNFNFGTKNHFNYGPINDSPINSNFQQPPALPPTDTQNIHHNLNSGTKKNDPAGNSNFSPQMTQNTVHHGNNHMRHPQTTDVQIHSQSVPHRPDINGQQANSNFNQQQKIPQNENNYQPQNTHHYDDHFNSQKMNGHHQGNQHFSPDLPDETNYELTPQTFYHYYPAENIRFKSDQDQIESDFENPTPPSKINHHDNHHNNFSPKILNQNYPQEQNPIQNYPHYQKQPQNNYYPNYSPESSTLVSIATDAPNINFSQNDKYEQVEEEEEQHPQTDGLLVPPESAWLNYQSPFPMVSMVTNSPSPPDQYHYGNGHHEQQQQLPSQPIHPESYYSNGGVPYQVLDIDDFIQNEPTTPPNPPTPPPPSPSPATHWRPLIPTQDNNKTQNSRLILDILDEHLIRLTDWYKSQKEAADHLVEEEGAGGQQFEIATGEPASTRGVNNMGQMVLNGKLCSNLDTHFERRMCKRKRRRRPVRVQK